MFKNKTVSIGCTFYIFHSHKLTRDWEKRKYAWLISRYPDRAGKQHDNKYTLFFYKNQ